MCKTDAIYNISVDSLVGSIHHETVLILPFRHVLIQYGTNLVSVYCCIDGIRQSVIRQLPDYLQI